MPYTQITKRVLSLAARIAEARDIRTRAAVRIGVFAFCASALWMAAKCAGHLILKGEFIPAAMLAATFLILTIKASKGLLAAAKLTVKWKRHKIASTYKAHRKIRRELKKMTRKELLRHNEAYFLAMSGQEMPFKFKLAMLNHSHNELLQRTMLYHTFPRGNARKMRRLNFKDKINYIKLIKENI